MQANPLCPLCKSPFAALVHAIESERNFLVERLPSPEPTPTPTPIVRARTAADRRRHHPYYPVEVRGCSDHCHSHSFIHRSLSPEASTDCSPSRARSHVRTGVWRAFAGSLSCSPSPCAFVRGAPSASRCRLNRISPTCLCSGSACQAHWLQRLHASPSRVSSHVQDQPGSYSTSSTVDCSRSPVQERQRERESARADLTFTCKCVCFVECSLATKTTC